MAKIDVNKIAAEMQKLYAKDKKSPTIISTGSSVKTVYTDKDVVPLPENHPIRKLLQLPGLPFNKLVQVAGDEDCGKSTFAAETMVAAQRSGIQVILWDSEDKFDSSRFIKLGGDPETIFLIKTNETLKGGEASRKLIIATKEANPKAKVLLVWDSIGGSQSRSHAERELDDEKHAQPGQDAKENGSVIKMLVALINKYPDSIAVYMANQTYAKMGFMQKGDTTTGGKKIKYLSSYTIMLKRIKVNTKIVKGVEMKSGIVTRATVGKNHMSQGDLSVYKMDFEINALGSCPAEGYEYSGEELEES